MNLSDIEPAEKNRAIIPEEHEHNHQLGSELADITARFNDARMALVAGNTAQHSPVGVGFHRGIPGAVHGHVPPVVAKETKGWIGVDLDGTLALYDGWQGVENIGEPILPMLERVKAWVANGQEVRIMTARAFRLLSSVPHEFEEGCAVDRRVHAWLEQHGLPKLKVTCHKDFNMITLWDDRCVQVIPNTGLRADGLA